MMVTPNVKSFDALSAQKKDLEAEIDALFSVLKDVGVVL
jgi:hypothetical protein